MTRTALITGASHGIGLEVARQLGAAGFQVIVSARDAAKAEAAVRDLGGPVGRFLPLALDVADDESVISAEQRVRTEIGRLNLLVNNAAAFTDWSEMPGTADLVHARSVFDVNLFGTWTMIQRFLPLLRQSRPSRIVNVSSGAGSHGDMRFGLTTRGGAAAAYAVSKAALNALTAKLAAEVAAMDVVVTAVCPGFTATSPGMEEMGARPVEDGAASVVWAATTEDPELHGRFFRDGIPLPW